jgi:hypothetical protein
MAVVLTGAFMLTGPREEEEEELVNLKQLCYFSILSPFISTHFSHL